MKKLILAALCATALAACGDETDDHHDDHGDHGHDHEALAEDACAHMSETMEHVMAAGDPADAANAVSATHQPFHVMLPEVDGAHTGAVLFTPDEAGEFAFFTSAALPFAIWNGETQVAIEETEAVDACPGELSTMHLAALELGVEYTLVFGPSETAEVGLITLHAGDDHGHAD